VSKLRPMKQPNPISVRPRQGSKLEAVWNDNERSNKAMGDIIHSWAETFSLMTKASEQERTDD
jgi:hypothetical protein